MEGIGDFYVRYYIGHSGKFGHEFLEWELRADGKVRGATLPGLLSAPGGAKSAYGRLPGIHAGSLQPARSQPSTLGSLGQQPS